MGCEKQRVQFPRPRLKGILASFMKERSGEQNKDPQESIQTLPFPTALKNFALDAYKRNLITFNQIFDKHFIEQKKEENEVATHEEGHTIVAESLGGVVSKKTIVPEGGARGYCLISFNNGSIEDRVMGMMASLCGGVVAEEKIGKDDHGGTGSDMAKLDHLGNLLSRYIYQGKVKKEYFINKAFSLARACLSDVNTLSDRAFYLQQERVLV